MKERTQHAAEMLPRPWSAPAGRGRLNGRSCRGCSDQPPAGSPRRCVRGARAHRPRSVPTSTVRSEPSSAPRDPSRGWPIRARARSAPPLAVDARRGRSRHTPRPRTSLPPRSPRPAIRTRTASDPAMASRTTEPPPSSCTRANLVSTMYAAGATRSRGVPTSPSAPSTQESGSSVARRRAATTRETVDLPVPGKPVTATRAAPVSPRPRWPSEDRAGERGGSPFVSGAEGSPRATGKEPRFAVALAPGCRLERPEALP